MAFAYDNAFELTSKKKVKVVIGTSTTPYGKARLREYFLHPRIGWGPKSESVRQIIKAINVGEDTIAFIDDQPFERAEVQARNPRVRTYTHEQITELLDREEFDVPITEEARSRRLFYKAEEVRVRDLEQSKIP